MVRPGDAWVAGTHEHVPAQVSMGVLSGLFRAVGGLLLGVGGLLKGLLGGLGRLVRRLF